MSKVDALRAMREARYAANQARRPADAPSRGPAPSTTTAADAAPVKKAPVRKAAAPPDEDAAPGAPGEEAPEAQLCGHKNIGGKSCRRPAGHPEKNHRYT